MIGSELTELGVGDFGGCHVERAGKTNRTLYLVCTAARVSTRSAHREFINRINERVNEQ